MDRKRTALLSVYNKDGIVEFATELVAMGWDLLASGGTAKALAAAGLPVRDVASLVGDPILGHKVVTLSREVHAGLLADPTSEKEMAELDAAGAPYIDLVCIDLYPLGAEINREGATSASVREKTDIGGPTMLRSAAKGRRIVVSSVKDRQRVLTWLRNGEPNKEVFLVELALLAEYAVGNYCMTSFGYLQRLRKSLDYTHNPFSPR